MDLRFTSDELAFRDELRAFIRDHLPDDIRERMRLGYSPRKHGTLAAHPQRARLGGVQLAQGIWRARLVASGAHDLSRGEPAGACAGGVLLQHHDDRAGIDPVRYRGAEAPFSAA